MKMQRPSWFRPNIVGMCAPRQRWSIILCAISTFDTLLASVLLVFGDWVDALAIHLASGLTLAILLSRLAGQYTDGQEESSVDGSAIDSGVDQPRLILKSTPQI